MRIAMHELGKLGYRRIAFAVSDYLEDMLDTRWHMSVSM
jgi:hypothetical protein